MDVKDAALKFKLSERTIYEYLKLGLFENAKKNKRGHWVISKDSLCPYRIPSHEEKSIETLLFHILSALNKNQSISTHQIGLSKAKIKALFSSLEKEGLIDHIDNNQDDLFKEYIVTRLGIDSLNKKKNVLTSLLSKINVNINFNL